MSAATVRCPECNAELNPGELLAKLSRGRTLTAEEAREMQRKSVKSRKKKFKPSSA